LVDAPSIDIAGHLVAEPTFHFHPTIAASSRSTAAGLDENAVWGALDHLDDLRGFAAFVVPKLD
jgi:hypothetical protein